MSIFKRRKDDNSWEIVGDKSMPIRYLPSGTPGDDNYIPIDPGTGAKKVTVGQLIDASLRINGTDITIATTDWVLTSGVYVATKTVSGVSGTNRLNMLLLSEETPAVAKLWMNTTFQADTNTVIATCSYQPDVELQVAIASAISAKPITSTNVAELTYDVTSGSNIVIHDKNWDATGVYDRVLGKTQREINDGYIIAESGSDYIRYADGTQICWGNAQNTSCSLSKTANGNWYHVVVTLGITFTKPFIEKPKLAVGRPNGAGEVGAWGETLVTTTGITNSYWLSGTSNALTGWSFDYICIGRWK